MLASAAIITISACSGSTSSAEPSAPSGASSAPAGASAATGSEAVCADVAAVQSSVTALRDLDLKAVGTNGLTEAVTAVETALAGLSSSAGATATAEREALKTSLELLKAADAGLTSDASVQEKATELTTAIAGVETAVQGVQTALPGCGG